MKTKNKFFASAIGLLMVVLCAIGLTSCDQSMFCVHEWGEYTVIENATCSKEGVQERKCAKCGAAETSSIAKEAHVENPDDGDCSTPITCFVCGGIVTEEKGHVGGTATCKDRAKCFVCNKEYGEPAAHVPAEDDGDCTTPINCTVCGEVAVKGQLSHKAAEDDGDCTTPVNCVNCKSIAIKARDKHEGGAPTCSERARCVFCLQEYGDMLSHVPNEDDGDCTTPVTCATCGDIVIEANKEHDGGYATCSQRAFCSSCGMEYGDFAEHIPFLDDGDCTTEIRCSLCWTVTTEARDHHTGGMATCKRLARCDFCGSEYGDLADHVPNADDGDCTTAVKCSACGIVTTPANAMHTGGRATCRDRARCEYCNKEYGDLAGHTPNADDGDCTTAVTCSVCFVITTPANEKHMGGTATCKDRAECVHCGKEYGDKLDHTPVADDGDCMTDTICSVCGEVAIAAPGHTGGTATCKELAVCTVCSKTYGELADHIPNADDGDCTTDVTCSICGEVTLEGNGHTGGTATCKNKAVCSICGREYGDILEHTPIVDDGDCTTAVTCSSCGEVLVAANEKHSDETVWIKHLDTHYRVYSCCVVRASEPEAHEMVDGACTACGFRPTVNITSEEVSYGDKDVSIAISITDNPGITGRMMKVQYNTDMFTLKNAESGEALNSLVFTKPAELGSGCTFLWDSVEIGDGDIKDGEMLILTFDVSPRALEGEYIILLKISAYDNELNPFTLIINGGNITITNS